MLFKCYKSKWRIETTTYSTIFENMKCFKANFCDRLVLAWWICLWNCIRKKNDFFDSLSMMSMNIEIWKINEDLENKWSEEIMSVEVPISFKCHLTEMNMSISSDCLFDSRGFCLKRQLHTHCKLADDSTGRTQCSYNTNNKLRSELYGSSNSSTKSVCQKSKTRIFWNSNRIGKQRYFPYFFSQRERQRKPKKKIQKIQHFPNNTHNMVSKWKTRWIDY